jgi:hypothetical protein
LPAPNRQGNKGVQPAQPERVGVTFGRIARWAACLLIILVLLVTLSRSFARAAHKAADNKRDGFEIHETTLHLGTQALEATWNFLGDYFEWLLALWLAAASTLVASGHRNQWHHTTMRRCRAMLGTGLIALAWIGFVYAQALFNWAACSSFVCVSGLTSGLSFLPPHHAWEWNQACKAALHRAHGFAHCDKDYIPCSGGGGNSHDSFGDGHSFTEALLETLFGWKLPSLSLLSSFAEASSSTTTPPHGHSQRNATAFERCGSTLNGFVTQKESVLYTSQTVEGYSCFACLAAGLLAVTCNLALSRNHGVELWCLVWTMVACFTWDALASAVLHVSATDSAEASLYRAVDHLFGVRQLMEAAVQAFTSVWGPGSGTPMDKDVEFLKDAAALISRIPEVLHRRVQDLAYIFRIAYVLGSVAGVDDPEKLAKAAARIVVFFASLFVAWVVVPFVLGLRDSERHRTVRYVSIYVAYATYSVISSVGTHALSTSWSLEMNQRYETVYGSLVFAGAYVFLCACSMHLYHEGNLHSLLVLCTLLLVCFSAKLAVCNGILKESTYIQAKKCQAFSLEDEGLFARTPP